MDCQFIGRSPVTKTPHEIAVLLNLPDSTRYSFHSSGSADCRQACAAIEQLLGLFGWGKGAMCPDKSPTSRPAILGAMANWLAGSDEATAEVL
jgi:hypothetical protein